MDNTIWIIIAAFAGALGSGLVGWADAHEPFDYRIFMGTVWRAVLAAVASPYLQSTNLAGAALYIAAFLGGAGIDSIGNRIQGAITGNKESQAALLKQVEDDIKKLTEMRTQPPGGAQ